MIRAARLWSVHHARCQCRDVDLQQCDIAQPNTARYDHYNHSHCTYIDDMIANADDHIPLLHKRNVICNCRSKCSNHEGIHNYSISIHNFVLPAVDSVRDLGVQHLQFDVHISLVVRTAMLRSRLILKCFSSRN